MWLIGIAVMGIGFWAGRVTMAEPITDSPVPEVLSHVVAEETISQTLSVVTVAEWPRNPVVVNLLDGVVTRLPAFDGNLDSGSVVYEVAGVPVRLVEGSVPFYRDLGPGIEGEDVAQLQRTLAFLGYFEATPDGRFGRNTTQAVHAWQTDLGLPTSGRIALGELISVPDLPRRVTVGSEIRLGRPAPIGSDALLALGTEPTFEVPLTDIQERAIAGDTPIVIMHEGREWRALPETIRQSETGESILVLRGSDGGPICAGHCDELPAEGRAQLRARIEVIPETTGPAVPMAAIQTDAAGRSTVTLDDGATEEVQIIVAASGLAIVEGLPVGERILLSGQSVEDSR